MSITGAAKIAGVVGYPVKHSLSPKLHNFWLKRYGIDGVYIPLEVKPEQVVTAVKAFPLMGLRGCNLTVPHKELVLDAVDSITDTAKRIGAVNTLVFTDGKIHGTNTDAYGFIENITANAPDFNSKAGQAVVIGAGGAARAVCAGLLDAGAPSVILTNRTRAKAEQVKDHIGGAITVIDWQHKEAALKEANLLVNTTTLGMVGFPDLDINLDNLPVTALVTDTVYKPLETRLLRQARLRGNKVVDGIGMLLYQAVPGFEAWFGVRPSVDAELKAYVLQGIA